jgi:hypothetical protein
MIIASQLREKKLFLKHIILSFLNLSLLFLSRPLSMRWEKKEHKQMEELEKERVFYIYIKERGGGLIWQQHNTNHWLEGFHGLGFVICASIWKLKKKEVFLERSIRVN